MRNWPWYTYVIVVVLILGLFYFIYYKPKNEELKELRAERIKLEQEVAELRLKKEQLDRIEAELKEMNATLEKLEVIIPKKEEISPILRQIQQLANDTRLNITRFDPIDLVDKEFYMEKPINIQVTGNYHNLGLFFDRLSSFSRLFNIAKFSVKALTRQSSTSTIQASYTAKTYIFQEQQPKKPTPPRRRR
jgi:type IV pilus assembly protein PilO